MINNEKHKIVLVLLLINKGEPLNNSYKLTRILEWKFRTVNTINILNQIKENNYADYVLINGIHYYSLTLWGKELIRKEREAALEILLRDFPQEMEFINSLFNSFLSNDVKL